MAAELAFFPQGLIAREANLAMAMALLLTQDLCSIHLDRIQLQEPGVRNTIGLWPTLMVMEEQTLLALMIVK